jgi:hexosaminidase
MKTPNQILTLILTLVFCSCSKERTVTEKDIQIIPKPVELKRSKGVFEFSENTTFVIANASQKEISNALINKFEMAAGWKPTVSDVAPKSNYIQFNIDDTFEKEAYTLEVNNETINITAKGTEGFLYALETVRQLLPVAIESKEIVSNIDWVVPNVSVKDKPRFQWRGLMLDLSRHFFDKNYIKETIDRLAMHKMNVLHLHLVDDQGWRIETKKYPKLTEVGAWRVDQEEGNC